MRPIVCLSSYTRLLLVANLPQTAVDEGYEGFSLPAFFFTEMTLYDQLTNGSGNYDNIISNNLTSIEILYPNLQDQ
jgi:hypothetical protein